MRSLLGKKGTTSRLEVALTILKWKTKGKPLIVYILLARREKKEDKRRILLEPPFILLQAVARKARLQRMEGSLTAN
jgi:hypothetical protein